MQSKYRALPLQRSGGLHLYEGFNRWELSNIYLYRYRRESEVLLCAGERNLSALNAWNGPGAFYSFSINLRHHRRVDGGIGEPETDEPTVEPPSPFEGPEETKK